MPRLIYCLRQAVGFRAALIGALGSLRFGCVVGALLTLGYWAGMPRLRKFGVD